MLSNAWISVLDSGGEEYFQHIPIEEIEVTCRVLIATFNTTQKATRAH